MKVNLLYAAKPMFGGWPSFTAHLALQLQEQGHEVALFKAGNRTEQRLRPFGRGLFYQNIAPEAAATLRNVIVTAVDKHGIQHAQVLAGKACFVAHDPTELNEAFTAVLARSAVVTIRRAVQAKLPGSVFIAHPYQRFEHKWPNRAWNAVACSRVDWDKNTLMIVQANEQLDQTQRVRIYGACNRMYAHHKLASYPTWEQSYHGQFANELDAGMRLCEQAGYMVDLSVIAGDGGGSQYTFLEAWNAGCHLVVHRKWLQPDDELVDGHNCTSVASAEELVELLKCKPDSRIATFGEQTLSLHSASVVVPQYVRMLA